MNEKQISSGRRPRNPLLKRVWKDMLRDWKRYLMICLMLIVTIGFVSGMYVANNSMLHSIDQSIVEMKREDGHFQLSEKADEKTLKAIENGAVPVTIYEHFYKDTDEVLPSDSDYTGTVRVYGERRNIDLYDILKGRAPENENEILIDRMHADNAGISVGDSIKAGNARGSAGGASVTIAPHGSVKKVRNSDKMWYLEHGTSRQAAHPFMTRTLNTAEPKVMQAMQEKLDAAIGGGS